MSGLTALQRSAAHTAVFRAAKSPAAAPRQSRSSTPSYAQLSSLRRAEQALYGQKPSVGRGSQVPRSRFIVSQAVTRAPSATPTTAAPSKRVTTKKVAVITGASSGLGLATTIKLAKSGEWFVVMACRDFPKAEKAARAAGLSRDSFQVIHLDLASLESVRQFVNSLHASGLPVDVLVCNAAIYLPTAKEPTFTGDGFELSVGTNHLGHFLLVNLLLDDLKKRKAEGKGTPRCIIVGSITGNTNTLAGNVPPKADLGDLSGLAAGLDGRAAVMIDGKEFDGAKAYKDSKVCNMLTMRELHKKYHDSTGIVFSSLYPGCIAETGLFRTHYGAFQKLFPLFQKYVTKGYVSEEEAGRRLAEVVSSPKLEQSGVYWSWDTSSSSFQNDVSDEVQDDAKARKLWELSEKLVGLK